MKVKLPIWVLIPPFLMIVIYAGLIFAAAFGEQTNFYDPMGMPLPNHQFMHISWTGKVVVMWSLLVFGTFSRSRAFLQIGVSVMFLQQTADLIAAFLTDVFVPITWIGLILSVISFIVIGLHIRRIKSK
jgi:hypothetical protein|tara:strand:- start:783 stop:1169 length:387 start_codon:yes stop_codon:yes gene_type:complete